MKKVVWSFGSPLVLLLLVPMVFAADNAPQFLREFSQDRHVYDYANLLPDASGLETQLSPLYGMSIYIVTLSKESNLGQVKAGFQFENTEALPDDSSSQRAVNAGGEKGTIKGFMDVQCMEDKCDNYFKATGFEPCWPARSSDERDWRAIWEEHACMAFPETFERIEVNFEWLGEQREGYYEVSIATNALLGEVYLDGDMWRFRDRDGYVYDLAPKDPNNPVYSRLNLLYNDPQYSVSAFKDSTLTNILWEKYSGLTRLKGGTEGYPLPSCTDSNRKTVNIINMDEGSSTKLTGYATLDKPGCKVVVFFRQGGDLTVGTQDCSFKSADFLNTKLRDLINKGKESEALLSLIDTIKGKAAPAATSPNGCEGFMQTARTKYSMGHYREALADFQEAQKSCLGNRLLLARYREAEIFHFLREDSRVIELGWLLFEDSKQVYEQVAKGSLRLLILSNKELNSCEEVNRIAGIWQAANYGPDDAVEITVTMCQQGKSGPNPRLKDPLMKILETKQANYQAKDYPSCLSGLEDNYQSSKAIDGDSAKGLLELLIKCSAGIGDCVTARNFYSEYESDYQFSQQLEDAMRVCAITTTTTIPPNQPGLKSTTIHTTTTSVLSGQLPQQFQEGTTEWQTYKKILEVAWGHYSRGDLTRAFGIAAELMQEKFEKIPSNKNDYADLYKSGKKLQLLCLFESVGLTRSFDLGQTCNSIYNNYYTGFKGLFGADTDLENAYAKCNGNQVKHSTTTFSTTTAYRSTSTIYRSSTTSTTITHTTPVASDLCKTKWPTNEGPIINNGGLNPACNLYETGSSKMDWIIDQARNCCNGNEQSSLCEVAREYSTLSDSVQNLKRCVGIYIVKGIGEYAKYMEGYFHPEVNCLGYLVSQVEPEYAYQCNSHDFNTFNEYARALPCRSGFDIIWESDTDMSQNSCNLVAVPAHASLNILKTGTCMDYSVAVTTLLRRAGYSSSDVMTVSSAVHSFNFVRLPGDAKYHYVDTTGNNLGLTFSSHVVISGLAGSQVQCSNDKGYVTCPESSMLIEAIG